MRLFQRLKFMQFSDSFWSNLWKESEPPPKPQLFETTLWKSDHG